MKTLDKPAGRVFKHLISLMGTEQHLKIDNSKEAFMPVIIEFLYDTNIAGREVKIYSLSHYFKMNGDQVPDPDMEFAIFEGENFNVIPIAYQDQMFYKVGIYRDDVTGWKINRKEQADQVSFANFWLKNIEDQQNLKIS